FERAARIVAVLAARKLIYAPDPAGKFAGKGIDVVRFPIETLNENQGDCDDLSVLLASSWEAAGVAAAFITTPGHIFVAHDSGLPSSLLPESVVGAGGVVDVDGRAFVPIEATALAKGYVAAWQSASSTVKEARAKKSLGVVLVRDAWRAFPPAPYEQPPD